MIDYFKKLYAKSTTDFYKEVELNLKNKKKMFIITANPETFTYGINESAINKMLLDKEVTLIPDGIGIVKASHILNYKVKERITGVDLAEHLLKVCNENKYQLALLGAKEEVIEALKAKINKEYPNIKLVKVENGYVENKDKFFQELSHTNVDVCLVALGIPNQELLIYKHLNKFKKGIFVGVGGSFDVISGVKKRAPKIIQKLNLEWLYRLIKEPKRCKRFYQNNVKFIFKVKKLKKETRFK